MATTRRTTRKKGSPVLRYRTIRVALIRTRTTIRRRIEDLQPVPDDLDDQDAEPEEQHANEPERRVVVGPV
jgi:hypothetical protein